MAALDIIDDFISMMEFTPSESYFWRNISYLIRNIPANDREDAITRLVDFQTPDSRAAWLKYSALYDITHDWQWLGRQADLFDQTMSADAGMLFLGAAYSRAIALARTHGEFRHLMAQVQIDRIQAIIAASLPAAGEGPPIANSAVRRVAVYAPHLVGGRHAPTDLALNLLAVLAQAGLAARLFTAQEMSIPSTTCQTGGSEVPVDPGFHRGSLVWRGPGGPQVVVGDTRFSLRHRLVSLDRAINAFNPDMVLFVGPCSPLIYRLHDRYPILGLGTHATAPMVPMDAWLSAQHDVDNAGGALSFSPRFWPHGPATTTTADISGIPKGAIVIATAGVRLHREITPDWGTRMLELLDKVPNTHWLLIGQQEGQPRPDLPAHPRLHVVPTVTNLPAWLAAADIYANPARLGGGASVAMAMEQGLAVAAFAGGDGGDKLGDEVMQDADTYFATLANWIADPAARAAAGARMRQRFHDRLDISTPAAAQALVSALTQAYDWGRQRLQGTPV